jgi:hypothetical protein
LRSSCQIAGDIELLVGIYRQSATVVGHNARMLVRLTPFVTCGFLIGCGTRIPRPIVVPATPSDESVLAIPRDTEAEHLLAKYKHHYEQFRHVENLHSNLSIQQEARLAQDYANACEAFNYWLWFVTDSVKARSELEPPGSDVEPGKHPTHRHYVGEYRSRATDALSAIRTFDSDLSDALHISGPASAPGDPYSLGYDIVHTFSRLGPDNARIAGDELMQSYSWAKQ